MGYDIKKTDGTQIYGKEGLAEGIIDNEKISNIGLIGKLYPNYGETQSNNFVHLAENFANESYPQNPLVGMLCYRKDLQSLYVCINENILPEETRWKKIPNVNISDYEPLVSAAEHGDLWFNDQDKKLYIFDKLNTKWIAIGPEDYLNKSSVTTQITSGASNETRFIYDFNENKEYDNTSYLATIKIIGKEIIQNDSTYSLNKETETGAWIVKCLINSFELKSSEQKYTERKIIGEPTYELIGKTNGVAENWDVKVLINNDKNLEVIVYGEPTNYTDYTYINWLINIDMIKVF